MDFKNLLVTIKKFVKSNLKILAAILLGLGIFIFAFRSCSGNSYTKALKRDNKEFKIKIDSIQKTKGVYIDSLNILNRELKKRDLYIIEILEDRSNILEKIKNQKNEKLLYKKSYFNSDTLQRVRLWAKLTKENK